MKKILFLMMFLFLVSQYCFAQVYTFDFEGGTDGQKISETANEGSATATGTDPVSYDPGWSRYDAGKVKNGSRSAQIFYSKDASITAQNINSQIFIDIPNRTIVNGTTEIWFGGWYFFGTSSDNPSGEAWSWRGYNNGATNIKILRVRVNVPEDGPDSNGGWDTIDADRPSSGNTTAWMRADSEIPTLAITDYNSQQVLTNGSWMFLECYVKYSTDPNVGQITVYKDGTVYASINGRTLDETQVSKGAYHAYGIIMSTFNPSANKDQYVWVDDIYYSFNGRQGPYATGGGGPATDTTDPTIDNIDPADGTSGVQKDSKVMTFSFSDTETGVDPSTLRVNFNGVNVTGDLGFSNNASSSVAYLTLSGLSLSDGTAYDWDVGSLQDNADIPNIIDATISGTLTTSQTAAAATFGAFDTSGTGTSDSYSYKDSGNWYPTFSDGGDVKLALNNGDHNAGEEYALYDGQTYTSFNVTGDFKSNETLGSNAYADVIWIFNFQDQDNYTMYVASNNSGICGFWEQVNGTNTQLTSTGEAIITDNNDKTFQLKNNNGTVEMYFGGTLKDSLTSRTIISSKIGFGSLNDQAYFDDIQITEQQQAQAPVGGGTFFEAMRGV